MIYRFLLLSILLNAPLFADNDSAARFFLVMVGGYVALCAAIAVGITLRRKSFRIVAFILHSGFLLVGVPICASATSGYFRLTGTSAEITFGLTFVAFVIGQILLDRTARKT